MSKVILVAGMVDTISIPYQDYDVIGVDRGAINCLNQGISIKAAVGDFDSINEAEYQTLSKVCTCIRLPEHKNETDSEVAIQYALQQGYEEIILYGALGGRMDHELANLYMLMYREYPLTIMNNQNRLRRIKKGIYKIPKSKYKYLSFLPLEDSCLSEYGVAYPLDHQLLSVRDIFSISNEITEDFASVEVHQGSFIMIESNDLESTSRL